MFKKDCIKCGERINKRHNFCPVCGTHQGKNNDADWGMLGKSDVEKEDILSDNFLKGFSGGILNKMLGSAMKMLENEMKKEALRENQHQSRMNTNIRLMINGKEVDLNNLKNSEKNSAEKKEKEFTDNFSKKSLEMFSKLPKKEPSTTMRRLADKIIYEITLPGVNSLQEISIIKLESSIEIKAVSKKHAYFKLIPINLPIKNYDLAKGKLVLELDTKN